MRQLILQIAIFLMEIIIFYIFLLSKSYLQKKGENLATSEDIENITKKIETVKFEFAKEFEINKNEYNLLFQRLNSFDSKKDDLVFQVLEEASKLFNDLSYIDSYILSDSDGKPTISNLDKFVKPLNEMLNSTVTNRAKLVIFFGKDEEFLKSIDLFLAPIYKACSALNKLSAQICNKINYVVTDDTDISQLEDKFYKEAQGMIVDYIKYVFSLNKEFQDSRLVFLNDIQIYYDRIRSSSKIN